MIPCIIMKEEKKSIDKGIINTLHRRLKARFRLPPINKWSNRTTKTTVWQTFKHKHIVYGRGEARKSPCPSVPRQLIPCSPAAARGARALLALLKNTQGKKTEEGKLWGRGQIFKHKSLLIQFSAWMKLCLWQQRADGSGGWPTPFSSARVLAGTPAAPPPDLGFELSADTDRGQPCFAVSIFLP